MHLVAQGFILGHPCGYSAASPDERWRRSASLPSRASSRVSSLNLRYQDGNTRTMSDAPRPSHSLEPQTLPRGTTRAQHAPADAVNPAAPATTSPITPTNASGTMTGPRGTDNPPSEASI